MKKERGITLIALVITIIVLLILAAVSIATLTGDNGILTKTNEAKAQTEVENLKEMVKTDILDYQTENRSGNVTAEQLRDVLDKYFKEVPKTAEDLQKNLEDPNYTLEAKDQYGEKIELKVSDIYKGTTELTPPREGPTVTINGKTVTKEEFEKNPKNYLGKVVTNFKDEGTGTEDVDGVIVSTKYRLYYIDFENKYKDGEGTIYLKAECTSNHKSLTLDETDSETKNSEEKNQVKIKQLNPSLYASEKKSPPSGNPNMQAVTWLLNENNWSGLKNNLKTGGIKKGDINYIVGAPSVEIMMDSYNKYYGLTDEPAPGACNPGGERKKLVNNYETGMNGYQVGPGPGSLYREYTSNYSVQTDNIDTMYHPEGSNCYWLASPSVWSTIHVIRVNFDCGGRIGCNKYYNDNSSDLYTGFCPLVSLKPTANVKLES